MQCPTTRIKSEVSEGNSLGYVVINEIDYDSTSMQLFEEPTASSSTPAKSAAPAPTVSAPWAAK